MMLLKKSCGLKKKEPIRDWVISCVVPSHSYDAQIFMWIVTQVIGQNGNTYAREKIHTKRSKSTAGSLVKYMLILIAERKQNFPY